MGFVYTAFVGQVAHMLTGIPGVNYLFTIGNATLISSAFLFFEGRRWRFALNNTLFSLLTLPTYFVSVPFDVIPRIALIINGIQADSVLNTFYEKFSAKKKLLYWSIFCSLESVLISPIMFILFYSFYLPNYASAIINIVMLLLPVIIVESLIGGIIGFYVYQRANKTRS